MIPHMSVSSCRTKRDLGIMSLEIMTDARAKEKECVSEAILDEHRSKENESIQKEMGKQPRKESPVVRGESQVSKCNNHLK